MTDAAALPGQPRGMVVSGPATARAVNILAPNASAMTLDGTNTWLVSEPGSDLAVVIDPGPLDDVHLRAVIAAAEQAGQRVALTLLTHGHPDHAEGAARFAELTGTKVRALDPALRLGDEGLAAGDVIRTGGLELRVVPTPGHTADSLCFHLLYRPGGPDRGHGPRARHHRRGPPRRAPGRLPRLPAAKLHSLTVDDGVHTVLPGHGPVLDDAQGAVEFYLAHRAHRLAQIETAVENGFSTPAAVVEHVYKDVDRSLWPHGGMVRPGAARVPPGPRTDPRRAGRLLERRPGRLRPVPGRVLVREPRAQVLHVPAQHGRILDRVQRGRGRGPHLRGALGVVLAEDLRRLHEVAGPAAPPRHDQREPGAHQASREEPASASGTPPGWTRTAPWPARQAADRPGRRWSRGPAGCRGGSGAGARPGPRRAAGCTGRRRTSRSRIVPPR